jgi:hypothetical protein
MHKNGYLIYKKLETNPHHKDKIGHRNLNRNTKDIWPKTLHTLAAGEGEEGVQQEDLAYTDGSFSLP